ncbi:MAG TPA: chromate efflux transporter [Solirubrobacteraceae bacterium]|nr:chromate efflux transporter [Solirubrobacteraceae bacterium]
MSSPSLAEILREWGRIGCIGFGGPPVHISLLRELCVNRRGWLSEHDFERALAAVNILPGPSSTQLAIYCAWRLRGGRGAVLGGCAFIVPGLVLILALSALFLAGSPPRWVRGAGLGAGAAVAAVAVRAGLDIGAPIWLRTPPRLRSRVAVYALAGATAAALTGPWLVLVLLACGAAELALQGGGPPRPSGATLHAWPALLATAAEPGGLASLLWTALKVGALAFGGGFVIVPLMQADAVGAYHWMSHEQFLNAVALGQVTPGPLVQTVAAVGYAAGGVGWGLLAALVAFLPSFSFVLIGAARFERLLDDRRARAFLAGAAPAAAGAIVGSAIPLAGALGPFWQVPLLAAAAVALLVLRGPIVATLLGCGAAGVVLVLLGAPVR